MDATVEVFSNGVPMGEAMRGGDGVCDFNWNDMPQGLFNVRVVARNADNVIVATKTFLVDVAEVEAYITFVAAPQDGVFGDTYSIESRLDGEVIERPILRNRPFKPDSWDIDQGLWVHNEQFYRGDRRVRVMRDGAKVATFDLDTDGITLDNKYPLVHLREMGSTLAVVPVGESEPAAGGAIVKAANFTSRAINGGLSQSIFIWDVVDYLYEDGTTETEVSGLLGGLDEIGRNQYQDVSLPSLPWKGSVAYANLNQPNVSFTLPEAAVSGMPGVETGFYRGYSAFPSVHVRGGDRVFTHFYQKDGVVVGHATSAPVLPTIKITPYNVGSVSYPGGRGHPLNNEKPLNLMAPFDPIGSISESDAIIRVEISVDPRGRQDAEKINIRLPSNGEGVPEVEAYIDTPEGDPAKLSGSMIELDIEDPFSSQGTVLYFKGKGPRANALLEVDVLDGDGLPINRVNPSLGSPARLRMDFVRGAILPDPATHVLNADTDRDADGISDYVSVLTGDIELLEIAYPLSGLESFDSLYRDGHLRLRLDDPEIAAFVYEYNFGNVTMSDEPEIILPQSGIPVAGIERFVGVLGKKGGETTVSLERVSSEGPVVAIATRPIIVGGEFEVSYANAPTFTVEAGDLDGPYKQYSDADTSIDPGGLQGQDVPLFGNASDGGIVQISQSLKERLNEGQTATFTVALVDAKGQPKMGRPVVAAGLNGYAEQTQPGGVQVTGANGQTEIEVSANVPRSAYLEDGVPRQSLLESVQFYMGADASRLAHGEASLDDYRDRYPELGSGATGDFEKRRRGEATSGYFESHQRFTGSAVVQTAELVANDARVPVSVVSIQVPVIQNVVQEGVRKWAEGGSEFRYTEFMPGGLNFLEYESDGGGAERITLFEESDFPLRDANARSQIIDYASSEINSERFPDAEFQQGEDDEFSYKALSIVIATETGKALVPGADVWDLGVEFIWKPLFRAESPDKLVGLLSGLGLLADFGHLIPGAGNVASTVVNYFIGAARAGLKLVNKIPGAEPTIEALVRMGGSIKNTVKLIFKYGASVMQRRSPNGIDFVKNAVEFIQTLRHLLQNKLEEGVSAGVRAVSRVEAISRLARSADRWFNRYAQAGLAYLYRKGLGNVGTRILTEKLEDGARAYSDDVAEAVFELMARGSDGTRAAINIGEAFSDQAIEGLAKFIKHAEGGNTTAAKAVADQILDLPAEDADLIFRGINRWSDEAVESTGTVEDAVRSVSRIASHSDFGPQVVADVLKELGEGSGHGYVRALGDAKNLDEITFDGIGIGRSRAADSIQALKSTPAIGGANDIVAANLGVEISSMKEFHGLRNMHLESLSSGQLTAMKRIRDDLGLPMGGDMMRKIIKESDINLYLNQIRDPVVTGFLAKLDDVKRFEVPEDLIQHLRLDYPNGFVGQTRVGVLEFPYDEVMDASIPYGPRLGGSLDPDYYPGTGNGLTASTGGYVIPETQIKAQLESAPDLPVGTELYLIEEDGTKILVGLLNSDGTWVQ